jgi:hypothetical protein
VSKARKGAASIHIPGTSLGFGVMQSAKTSIVVPSIQYPGTVIHQKGKSISNNQVTKNNRSNLLINVHDTQQQQVNGPHTLSQSLSLKRLKTPKMKDAAVMGTLENHHLHTPFLMD